MRNSNMGAMGNVSTAVIPNPRPMRALSVEEIEYFATPRKGLSEEIADWKSDNMVNFNRGFSTLKRANELGIRHMFGRLWISKITAEGDETDYGLVSLRVVTDVGVNFIVDAFQNTVELENLKYHGIGTDNTAEAQTNTTLGAELTTQYNPNSTRATGSTTEGATSNVYRTVGTNAVDATVAIVEHGIFDQAATGGGTLLDRSVFGTINLDSGDSLQTTYDLTFTAGS